MREFIPVTRTINRDRKYFITSGHFVKYDRNIKRGQRESSILKQFNHPAIPKVYGTSQIDGWHVIEMSLMPGKTLENLQLKLSEKALVMEKLFEIFVYLAGVGISHGDINVSNVLWNGTDVALVDWETGQTSKNNNIDKQALVDLFTRI